MSAPTSSTSTIALVQLGALGAIDATFLFYCGALTVLVLALHIVLRFQARDADPSRPARRRRDRPHRSSCLQRF